MSEAKTCPCGRPTASQYHDYCGACINSAKPSHKGLAVKNGSVPQEYPFGEPWTSRTEVTPVQAAMISPCSKEWHTKP